MLLPSNIYAFATSLLSAHYKAHFLLCSKDRKIDQFSLFFLFYLISIPPLCQRDFSLFTFHSSLFTKEENVTPILHSTFFILHLRTALYPLADPFHSLQAVFTLAEGGETHVSLAARTESHAGSADHMGLIEHLLEEFPRRHIVRSLQP